MEEWHVQSLKPTRHFLFYQRLPAGWLVRRIFARSCAHCAQRVIGFETPRHPESSPLKDRFGQAPEVGSAFHRGSLVVFQLVEIRTVSMATHCYRSTSSTRWALLLVVLVLSVRDLGWTCCSTVTTERSCCVAVPFAVMLHASISGSFVLELADRH